VIELSRDVKHSRIDTTLERKTKATYLNAPKPHGRENRLETSRLILQGEAVKKIVTHLLVSSLTLFTIVLAQDEGAYPRTITDFLEREVTFEKRPERIALDTNRYALNELLLLGVAPMFYQVSESEELAVWTQEKLEELGINLVNYNGQPSPTPPNLEQLASLKPDLIIMLAYREGGRAEEYELYDLYQEIAPVFFVEYTDLDASRIRMVAEVFAVEDKLAEIEARDAELFAQVTPPPPGVELALGFGYKDASGVASQVYNGGSSELIVLERAGFTIKDYGRPQGERDFNVSEEKLTMLEADMLWNVAPYPGDSSAEDFESSVIVQNLEVYKEGRYRSLNSDQSQAILFWTPLATPFLVETLNELVASYDFE
jgi:ABC-type Fe3+-hydroxamate transport system substrate-binding protein